MDTMTTVKPLKPLTIKQLLSKKMQETISHYEDGKETFERSGLIVFRQRLLIDVKQKQPIDAENRLITMSRECLKRNVSCRIVPDRVYNHEGIGDICAMVEDDIDRINICEVNDLYRRTAEEIGSVVEWHFYPHEWLPAIIGIDTEGNRRAAIACIIDNR